MKPFSCCLLLAVLLSGACEKREDASSSSPHQFAIYLLRDTSITAVDAQKRPLESHVLAPEPFLTEKDIEAYHWSTHSFTARRGIDSVFARMRGWRGKSPGVPFVVMVGKERIYLGALWWGYSSMLPQVPYIDVILSPPYYIQPEPLRSQADKRQDQRIRNALQAAGVLAE